MVDAIRQFFEAHAPGWDDRMPPNYEAVLRAFAAPFAPEIHTAGTILEIGAGTGALIPVVRTLAPAARLISVDFAYAMLSQARRRCPTATLEQADVHALPFKTGSVDRVICHNSFPHFADKRRALEEIRRVLCPGGQLLILHNNSREFVNGIHTRAGEPIQHDLLPPGDEIHQLLTDAGYRAVQVEDLPTRYVARGWRAS